MSENSNDMTTPQQPISEPTGDAIPQEPIANQVGEPITPATPLPANAEPAVTGKGNGVRTAVLAGAGAIVGAALVLGAGAIGYSIGNHDSDNHRDATMSVSGEHHSQQDGPMMGGDGQGGMDQRGIDPDGDNWTGQNRDGGMMGGHQDGPMMGGHQDGPMMGGHQDGPMMGGHQDGPMMGGNGIQDFMNQLQNGQGLTAEQQQMLEQLQGFVNGLRGQQG